MGKPEDLSVDAWNAAVACCKEMHMRNSAGVSSPEAFIARAIMVATAAEREACALIALDEDGALPGWGEHRNAVAAQQAGKEIAAAIRARNDSR